MGLIHGELGPDHVLVASDGTPVLIDIEGELAEHHAGVVLAMASASGL